MELRPLTLTPTLTLAPTLTLTPNPTRSPSPSPNPSPNPNQVVSPTSSISRLLAPVAESDLRAAERSVLHTLQIMLRQRHTLALVRQQQQAALEG